MLTVFIRSIIIYVLLIIVIRLMGKRQIGELQPFEFVITLVIAEVACIPMSDTSIPLSHGIIPIFTLFILHLFITKIAKASVKFRKVLNGKPVIVINPQGIDNKVLDKLDFDINDLLASIRAQGYFSPAEIQYAILETNGKISIMPKAANKAATVGDIKDFVTESEIPYTLICEGKLMQENVKLSGIAQVQIDELLNKHSLTVKNTLLLTVNEKTIIYLQPYNAPAIYDKFPEAC